MADWQPIAYPGGHNTSYCAIAVDGDSVWLLGGYQSGRLATVSRFDLATLTWGGEAPLTLASDPGPSSAAVIGGVAYFVDDNNLYSLELASGTQAALTPPAGSVYGVSVHEHGGLLYWLGPVPQRYDPATGAWEALAAAPFPVDEESTSAIDDAGHIYVNQRGQFARYDVLSDSWTVLASSPTPVYNCTHVAHGGRVTLVAGVNASTNSVTNAVQQYDIASDSWTTLAETPGQGGSSVGAIVTIAGAPTLVSISSLGAFIGGAYALTLSDPSVLEVMLSVEYPVTTTDAYLTVNVDVTGGPGVHADVMLAFTTGWLVSASAMLTVDVTPAAAVEVAPGIVAPAGNLSLVQPQPGVARRLRQLCNADEYSLAWGVGSQLTGSVTGLGLDADPTAEDGFAIEPVGARLSREWRHRGASGTTREYQAVTAARAESTLLPELMPVATIDATPGLSVGDCLRPQAASLCSADDLLTRCAMAALLPQVLPTRHQLAELALAHAGITLVIQRGTLGIPQLHEAVSPDYRTEGKTAAQVTADLLLTGAAPHWYAPDTLIVHGGGLTPASVTIPAGCSSGSLTTQPRQADAPAEPQLADYLAECSPAPDAADCNTETFETARSGTLTWTENAGAGRSYEELTTTLVKEDGRVVREEVTVRRAVWALTTDPGGGVTGGETIIAPVEWTVREHTYLACCPTALAHTLERTWVTRFNTDVNADFTTAPGAYLASQKEVTQAWHAEGWLRSRVEVTDTHHGWRAGATAESIRPTYKRASRSETHAPIGGGQWHIATRVSDSIMMPVDDGSLAVLGAHWGEVVNNYTIVTDQAPAQVTCDDGSSDPCDPSADCAALRTAAYERDHAEWVALTAALAANDPEERQVLTLELEGRRSDYQPGRVVDGWLVASVSWAGSGPRAAEEPGESTSVELWAAVEA